MKSTYMATLAALAMVGATLPTASLAAQVKHKKLKTVAAGVAGYELAKHSHSKFMKKHKMAAGIVGAAVAHHYMKKKTH